MELREVLEITEGKVVSRNVDLDQEVQIGYGADLMSDVLAFAYEGALLRSGLTNLQVVRTAEIAGLKGVVFVRGKIPPPQTIALAEEKGIPLLASKHSMFETSGGFIGQDSSPVVSLNSRGPLV